jgi:hypothetical protein
VNVTKWVVELAPSINLSAVLAASGAVVALLEIEDLVFVHTPLVKSSE